MSPESQTLQWPRTHYRRYRISKETIKRIWHWTELNNTQNPRGWSPAKMQHISPHQPRDFSLNHIGKILSFFNCFFQKKSVPLVTSTGRKSNHISYMNSLIVEKYYIYTKHEIWRIYLWTVFYYNGGKQWKNKRRNLAITNKLTTGSIRTGYGEL